MRSESNYTRDVESGGGGAEGRRKVKPGGASFSKTGTTRVPEEG